MRRPAARCAAADQCATAAGFPTIADRIRAAALGAAAGGGAVRPSPQPEAVHVSDVYWMIPLHVQPGDAARIHYRAGFDKEGR